MEKIHKIITTKHKNIIFFNYILSFHIAKIQLELELELVIPLLGSSRSWLGETSRVFCLAFERDDDLSDDSVDLKLALISRDATLKDNRWRACASLRPARTAMNPEQKLRDQSWTDIQEYWYTFD